MTTPATDITGPVRTCVGCRARAQRRELTRWVARVEGDIAHIAPDPSANAPGRGAWLHDDPSCLAQAQRRGALRHALRIAPGIRAELATTDVASANETSTSM